ncbi:unnamed protein product [Phaeothamnion confervicola]
MVAAPLRVAFVSRFLGAGEPHGQVLEGVLRHLPRPRFFIILCPIATAPADWSPRLVAAAERVVPLSVRRLENVATLEALRLDAIVFADMNSEPMTHFLGYARLAPVQILCGGNPVTSGNPSIDYFVSADVLEHPDRTAMAAAADEYSEQVVLLGGQGIWYAAPELPLELFPATAAEMASSLSLSAAMAMTAATAAALKPEDAADSYLARSAIENSLATDVSMEAALNATMRSTAGGLAARAALRAALRTRLGLSDDAIVYMCPQSLFKLHPAFDAIVGRVLVAAGPRAHAIFLEGRRPRWTETFRRRLTARIGPDVAARVRFAPRSGGGAEYFRLLAAADVLLQPFPFDGSRTSSDGLAVGVPVVTRPTRSLRGRMAAAFYTTMGMCSGDQGGGDGSDETNVDSGGGGSGGYDGSTESESENDRKSGHGGSSDDVVAPECCCAGSAAEYVSLAARLGLDADYRESVAVLIRERAPRLWARREVVYEWARFLTLALGAPPLTPAEIEQIMGTGDHG